MKLNCNKFVEIVAMILVVKLEMWVKANSIQDYYDSSATYYTVLNPENPDVIQENIGNNIKFECGLEGIETDSDNIEKFETKWYFKACGDDISRKPCDKYDEWNELQCDGRKCTPVLYLDEIAESNSGMYKCTIYPYKGIKLIRTYQLIVRNSTILPPEFFDNTMKNLTLKVGDRAILQCRAYSRIHLAVKWFKKISNIITQDSHTKIENTRSIRYLENNYELLKSPREKHSDDDIYLSKLILNEVAKSDEGIYVCVVINYRGHKTQEIYLTVEDEAEPDQQSHLHNEQSNTLQFSLLFLMPIGWIILPLTFWLCIKYCKEKSQNKFSFEEEQNLK